MELKRSKIVYVSPLTLVTLSACGGSSDVSNVAAAISQTVSGNVVNGPLSNALVFLDLNSNGILDNSETSVRTDANGAFKIDTMAAAFQLIAITDDTTIDTSSGEVYSGVTLKAPSDASVITPTTTLMEEGDLSSEEVASVLGLPDGVDPLKFNPYADGVDADDALAVAKLSNQLMTAVKSFAAAAEGAGAAELDAFEAALKSVVDVVKSKAAKLNDATATDADKVIDFTKTEDLDLIKAEAITNAASKSGVDKATFDALIDDTTTSIKNVNDQIKDVVDLTSDATKGVFSQSKKLLDQVKAAAEAEKATPGSGSIDFSNTEKLKEKLAEETEKAASNEAPTDISLHSTTISDHLYPLSVGLLHTTDSDQTDGFIYTIAKTEGTDYGAFDITYEIDLTGNQVGRLSFKEKPDLDASYTYQVTIISTDKYGKQVSKDFEILYLTNGDDTQTLSGNPDVVIGGDGNDIIIGTAEFDYLKGGDGDDKLIGAGGPEGVNGRTDFLNGGNGDDVLDASQGTPSKWGTYMLPGLGKDTILGNETLWNNMDGIDLGYWNVGDVGGITVNVGENGSGTVVSGDGQIKDTFTFTQVFAGTIGDDVFNGSDTSSEPDRKEIFLPFHGSDEVYGNGGYDTLYYDAGWWYDGIEVDFAKGTASYVAKFSGIEEIRGSPGDDVITAEGYETGIFVRGRNGNDVITGSNSDDTIHGGEGDDNINGGSGDDTLNGSFGNNTIDGGKGNDTIYGGYGEKDGNNTINGGEGDDKIYGGTGDDIIDGGSGDDDIYGSAGNDIIHGRGGVNEINGADGNDTIYVGDGSTHINGGAGDDIIYGSPKDDEDIDGDEGDDTIYGGDGDDELDGDEGDDTIYGENGNDILDGGDGNDILDGGAGDDKIYGGAGDDTVYASLGSDYEDGGDGIDTFIIDEVLDYIPAIDLQKKAAYLYGTEPTEENVVNFENIEILSSSDFVLIGDENANTLKGGSGNDVIDGGGGDDIISGGLGIDVFLLRQSDQGSDVILDFSSNDMLGLRGGLTSDDINLKIVGGDTEVYAGEELLATLKDYTSELVEDIHYRTYNTNIYEVVAGESINFEYTALDQTAQSRWADFQFKDQNGNILRLSSGLPIDLVSKEIPNEQPNGLYVLDSIHFSLISVDGSTVSTTYKSDGSTSDNKFHGFNLENYVIKVTGGVDEEPDLSPPELKSITISDPAIGANERGYLTYEAEDLGSGISDISFFFSNGSGNDFYVSGGEVYGFAISRITQNLPSGVYNLERVLVYDDSSNYNGIHYWADGTTTTYLGFSEPVEGSHNFNLSAYFFEITGEPVPVPTLDFKDTSIQLVKLNDNKVVVGEEDFIEYTVAQDILDVWRLEDLKLEFVYNLDGGGGEFRAYDLDGDGAARFVPPSNGKDGSYSLQYIQFWDAERSQNIVYNLDGTTSKNDGSDNITSGTHSLDFSEYSIELSGGSGELVGSEKIKTPAELKSFTMYHLETTIGQRPIIGYVVDDDGSKEPLVTFVYNDISSNQLIFQGSGRTLNDDGYAEGFASTYMSTEHPIPYGSYSLSSVYLSGYNKVEIRLHADGSTETWDSDLGDFVSSANHDFDFNAYSIKYSSPEDYSLSVESPSIIALPEIQAPFWAARETGDNITGSQGDDLILGGAGDDVINGGAGDDIIDAGAGDDIIDGGEGYDTLIGGTGNDRLIGGIDGDDLIDGGEGDDVLDASDILATGFVSYILPGLGNDNIIGSEALWNAYLGLDVGYYNVGDVGGITVNVGENGTGTVVSGDARINDTFTFAEWFVGTIGSDVFYGSDTSEDPNRVEYFSVYGGASNEVHGNGGHDVIDYFTFDYDSITFDFAAGTGTNISSFSGIEEIYGSNSNDTITALGYDGDVWLLGANGNDTMTGGNGNSFLSGDDGNDILNSGVGSDILIGGDGADSYIYQKGDGRDVIVGFREDEGDTLSLEGYSDEELAAATTTLVYGGWDDGQVRKELPDGGYIRIYTYASTIVGDHRVPEVLEGTTAADHIWGMDGNDTITGLDGNDYIGGGDGEDIIDGGLGADEISTGEGNDTVVIRQGDGGNTIVEADMISDFTDGSDLIGLHNLEFSDLTIVQGSGDYVNDALVSSGSEYLVLIEDIDVADLTVADFVVFDIV